MKHVALLLLALLSALVPAVRAQTVIDLDGGGVRAKTIDDYKQEQGIAQRLAADSVAYVDHLRRAFNALHRDSLDAAEAHLRHALKLRPDAPGNHIVRHYLGRIGMSRGEWRQAVDELDAALRLRPTLHEARYDRAVCYLEINSLAAARADCDQLLEASVEPDLRRRALFLRAALQLRSHQPQEARTTLEEILRTDPADEGAALLMADAYEQMGQPQQALERLNQFVAAHAESVDGLVARAELQQRMGLGEMAALDYEAATALAPADAALRVAYARLLLRLDRKGAARRELDAAVQLGTPREALRALYQEADR